MYVFPNERLKNCTNILGTIFALAALFFDRVGGFSEDDKSMVQTFHFFEEKFFLKKKYSSIVFSCLCIYTCVCACVCVKKQKKRVKMTILCRCYGVECRKITFEGIFRLTERFLWCFPYKLQRDERKRLRTL